MSIIETVKEKIKVSANIVTGKAATIVLETKGKFVAGEVMEVNMTVTAAGAPFESKGAFVDLTGEDDLKETLIEKARELVMQQGDPTYSIEVQGPFSLKAGEVKVIASRFTVPAGLDPARKWFIRGRVKALGHDPSSPFKAI